jgi:hypothetical protein
VTPVRSGPRVDPAEIAAQVHLAKLIVYEFSNVPGQIVVPEDCNVPNKHRVSRLSIAQHFQLLDK